MADVEAQASPPALPSWFHYVARIIACLAGFWAIIGGFYFLFAGGVHIFTGLLRIILGIFTMIVEASFFCVCFREIAFYQKLEEKLSVINHLHKAIIYAVVPIICLAISYNHSHLIDSIVFWVAAGLNAWAFYKIVKS